MNELLSSLSECSTGRDALHPGAENIVETVERTIRMTSVRPEFRRITFTHHHEGTAVGWFDGGPLDGRPALTTAERGQGRASYCGTLPDAATLAGLLAAAASGAGLTSLLERTAHGIEVQRRLGAGFEALFVLNHDTTRRTVRLAGHWEPAVGPAPRGLDLDLGPRELAVLRRDTGNEASPTRS